MRRGLLAILILMLAACGGNSSSEEQTLEANHAAMGTQIAELYQTATREADRLAITLEYAQTEIRRARNQGTALASTLIANGLDPNAVSLMTPFATPTANIIPPTQPATPDPNLANVPPTETPAGANGTRVSVTPFTVTPTGLAPPRLSNIVTSSGVGSDDCAIDTASQFSSDAQEIYVAAVANNIQPGMTITSRWSYEGTEQVAFDFVPDFLIEQACIWFFLEPADVAFTPGNWSVTLEINGGSVGAPVPFTITG
jgi:hypothetical protein